MQSLMALLFVPIMAILIRIQASSSADTTSSPDTSSLAGTTSSPDTSSLAGITWNEQFSEETKNTMIKLQKYLTDMDQEIHKFGNQLKQGNKVLEVLGKYRGIIESARNTNCKGADLSVDDDEHLLESFINDCTVSLPRDKISAFQSKIEIYKAIVDFTDGILQINAKTCDFIPTACEKNKKKALEYMNDVFSAKAKAELQNDVHECLVHAKEHLEKCFTQKSGELLNKLQDSANAIATCLSTISE